MAQYEVVNQRVEINGKTREVGQVLDESEFKPKAPEAPEEELTELESLVQSGHVALKE